MGRNSKRTLLGTIVLVVLFALTAYSADITFRFHIADEGVGYNSAAAHKDAYQYVVNIIVDDISRDSVLYQKKSVNMLVIDKKRMKIMDAGFPKMVTDNIPKRARLSKVPVVKAKIGPKITPLLCDEAIFDDVPVKAEIKAVVSGIYITSIKNLRNVAPPEPEKRGLRAKLTKKSAEYMRKN